MNGDVPTGYDLGCERLAQQRNIRRIEPTNASILKVTDAESSLRCSARLYRSIEMTPLAPLLQIDAIQSYRARAHGVRDLSAVTAVELMRMTRDTGVRCHLVGGWGVDALIGRQTRLHDDLDLAYESLPGSGKALELAFSKRGYHRVSLEEVPHALFSVRVLLADGQGRSLDLLPILPFDRSAPFEQPAESGRVALPHIPQEAFVVGSLGRRSAPMAVSCLSADFQLASRQAYELRPSDRHDLARILRLKKGTARRSGAPRTWTVARHRSSR